MQKIDFNIHFVYLIMCFVLLQGYGRSLWLVHGMFRANGGCGYVKKPDFLMDNVPDHFFDPKVVLPVKKTLKVNPCHCLYVL